MQNQIFPVGWSCAEVEAASRSKKLLFCQPQLVAMRTGYVDCAVARLLGQLSSADCAVYRLLQVSLDFIVSRLLGQWN